MTAVALAIDSLRYGPTYALCKAHLASEEPVDAAAAWAFWTAPSNKLVKFVLERYPPGVLVKHLLTPTSTVKHRSDVVAHYDVPSRFFMLFLDRKFGFYSCADFDEHATTLEEAQTRKAEHFLRLISPEPGQRLLELGCGWGAMIGYLQSVHNGAIEIDGVTISSAQAEYVRSTYNVEVEVGDFIRDEYSKGKYHHIYSMNAWEHVPSAEIPSLLGRLYAALKPGGRLVQDFSCAMKKQTPAHHLVSQFFFSGYELMTRDEQVTAAERVGFRLVHESKHDHRPTWKAWYDRLAANRDAAIALVGVGTYNKYLLLFALAWKFIDDGYSEMHRFAFEKPAET
jgi:cyclopropane-fatty-acyl-phospholipid synthase